jgi:chemotaxis protein methyltransferase CheR
VGLNDASHRIVADLLCARTGQQLTDSRLWRVSSALAGLFREHGLSNLDQLVCLLGDGDQAELATQVVEALLNNETYFFRDRAYFSILAETVLPDIASRRAASKRIRIWSAGCSTGQEVLSLAMLFAGQPERWADWDIEILGTDISIKALAVANSGLYSQFEIQRGISIGQMLQFFSETPQGWQANDAIRALARFKQASVLAAPPSPGNFDLVLCRNVLLYFDPPTRRAVFERLSQATAADGWLMLGAGETVIGQTDLFVPAPCGATLYQPVGSRRLAAANGPVKQAFAGLPA